LFASLVHQDDKQGIDRVGLQMAAATKNKSNGAGAGNWQSWPPTSQAWVKENQMDGFDFEVGLDQPPAKPRRPKKQNSTTSTPVNINISTNMRLF
jgi:hypothetical protein